MPRPLVVTIVGARPNFVKLGPVSRRLRAFAREVIIHTGQHRDPALSDFFFRELRLPRPDVNLGVSGGSPGMQVGRMMVKLEPVLRRLKPDLALVYGDTNSTLAGALAAAGLRIPVAHVESGLRSWDRAMPEELNRVATDHVSSLLFCPTRTAVLNLQHEGCRDGVHLSGDVMLDALLAAKPKAMRRLPACLARHRLRKGEYVVATLHRAANVDDPIRLERIVESLSGLGLNKGPTVVFPVHPRTRARLRAARLWNRLSRTPRLRLISPLGYLDFLALEIGALGIFTDSGGVQREAYFLGVPCVLLRRETEWPEPVAAGATILAGDDPAAIRRAIVAQASAWDSRPEGRATGRALRQFGSGRAADRIVKVIHQWLT